MKVVKYLAKQGGEGNGNETIQQNAPAAIAGLTKTMEHDFSYVDGSTAKDGISRLRILETEKMILKSGKKVSLGTGRTGFIPVEDQAAAQELTDIIKSKALVVRFGAQQGQAWAVELVEPGQASATSKLVNLGVGTVAAE